MAIDVYEIGKIENAGLRDFQFQDLLFLGDMILNRYRGTMSLT
jgi:hypothetical protein